MRRSESALRRRPCTCFNAFGGYPACSGLTPGTLSVSNPASPYAGIGFSVIGAEVSRTVAIEPIPEPTTAVLLGLGLLGLSGVARLRPRA